MYDNKSRFTIILFVCHGYQAFADKLTAIWAIPVSFFIDLSGALSFDDFRAAR